MSVPLAWAELATNKPPDRWTMATIASRLARPRVDPWKVSWRQTFARRAVAALERL